MNRIYRQFEIIVVPALPSLVADLAPVHVLAHVAALRVGHIEALVDGHILTLCLLSVNTDLE